MKKWFYCLHLLLVTAPIATSALASPQVMNALAGQLASLSRRPLSGSLYIDSKFEYRFYMTRSAGGIEVALRGGVFVDYTYHPKSQKLVVKWPTQKTGITLGPSANLKSIEWIVKSVYLGALADTDTQYSVRRKLGVTLDVFELELERSVLSKIEVSILNGSSSPSLLSVRALDPQKQEYLFLFD